MTGHGRTRGDKPSYPICVWNGIFDHYKKIGIALWEFLWLIDAITEEEDGIGWVYRKSPLKIERIATDLGIGDSTVRRNLDRLKNGGYIVTRRGRYGLVVGVVNSRKIRPRASSSDHPDASGQEPRPLKSEHSDRSKVSGLDPKSEWTGDSILNDNAVRQSSKTAEPPARDSELWNLLGVRPEKMPGRFRELCEQLYAAKNGQPLSEFVGACMDGWQALGEKRQPREFVQAATRIREEAKHPAPVPIRPLPEMPFQQKKVGQCQTKS
jgi:hypothetical protein